MNAADPVLGKLSKAVEPGRPTSSSEGHGDSCGLTMALVRPYIVRTLR